MLEITGVSAGYGAEPVLRDISLEVTNGELVGVIGPNGAGKTTLLRVLSGVLPTERGRALLHGRDLRALRRREIAREMAFVPQSVSVPVAFTVEELVVMGRTPYVAGWSPLGAHDREVVTRAMETTDVLGLAGRLFDELSAGEQQRVIVAMALAQEPRVLLLDEPTAHLDIQHAWRLMELVGGLNRAQGLTVVLSSHDLNLAAEFCSRLVLLEHGRIVREGTPADVVTPDLLSRVYEHPLDVMTLDGGQRRIVVARRVRS